MNYLTEIKVFYDLAQIKQLSCGQIALWHGLMYINNKCNWNEWFTVANLTLQLMTGLSRAGINKNRNVLKQLGLIDFKTNTTKATSYKLITMSKSNQVSSQDSSQISKQDSNQISSTLNKLNETKQKNKKEKNEMTEIYNTICNNLPKVQKITDKRKKAINVFLKGFSLEEFREICVIANNNSFLTGTNDIGWKADFDFLINPNKATSILEGKYGNAPKTDYKIEGGLQLL